jgi:anthranilate phosphoribosyltransferase
MLKEALHKLAVRESLTREEMRGCVDALLQPHSPGLAAAWLVALRMKGESPVEIAAVADALRARAETVRLTDPDAIDTCGTGGDGASTFNISTTAAFVVAGAGVTVAKHGNRAVSSSSGSADVLDALGVDLDTPTDRILAALEQQGIGFLFAQRHHPAMRHVGPIRRELGLRTIFNLAGPLSNPAGVRRQLVGVYATALVPVMAQTLALLGAQRAWVVSGADGLDELSLSGPTTIVELREDGNTRAFTVTPADAGLPEAPVAALKGGTAQENATITRAILRGEQGPRRDAVLLNSAAALIVAGRAGDLREGAVLAARSIDSGAALARLEGLLSFAGKKGVGS